MERPQNARATMPGMKRNRANTRWVEELQNVYTSIKTLSPIDDDDVDLFREGKVDLPPFHSVYWCRMPDAVVFAG